MDKVRTRYRGHAYHLTRPWLLRDPETLFKNHRPEKVEVDLDLVHAGAGAVYGKGASSSDDDDKDEKNKNKKTKKGSAGGDEFAKAHYEQHMRVAGTVRVLATSRRVVLDERLGEAQLALGLRDHSWGPRYWQAVQSYRWLTCNFTGRFGLVISAIGDDFRSAVVHVDKDTIVPVGGAVALTTRYADEEAAGLAKEGRLGESPFLDASWFPGVKRPSGVPSKRHHEISVTIGDLSKDGFQIAMRGEVMHYVPLRNRRAELVTTLGEGFTKYTLTALRFPSPVSSEVAELKKRLEQVCTVGQVGYGMSEYLDQQEERGKL